MATMGSEVCNQIFQAHLEPPSPINEQAVHIGLHKWPGSQFQGLTKAVQTDKVISYY